MQRLEFETLSILCIQQWRSLVCLDISEDSHWFSSQVPPCLESLAINLSPAGGAVGVPGTLIHQVILRNNRTLKSLAIGFEQETLRAYEKREIQAYSGTNGLLHRTSAVFIESMADAMKTQQRTCKAVDFLTVDTLRLSSFDLYGMLRNPLKPFVDFTRLTALHLESCSGLEDGLDHFTSDRGRQDSPSCLQSLVIRTELGSARLWSLLESFISSLSDLVNLCLLFEGQPIDVAAETILAKNGKKFRTLVLERRSCPRTSMQGSTSLISEPIASLGNIADFCPNLVDLGMNLDWMAVSNSDSQEVYQFFSPLNVSLLTDYGYTV